MRPPSPSAGSQPLRGHHGRLGEERWRLSALHSSPSTPTEVAHQLRPDRVPTARRRLRLQGSSFLSAVLSVTSNDFPTTPKSQWPRSGKRNRRDAHLLGQRERHQIDDELLVGANIGAGVLWLSRSLAADTNTYCRGIAAKDIEERERPGVDCVGSVTGRHPRDRSRQDRRGGGGLSNI
jgi:hypothetical protein